MDSKHGETATDGKLYQVFRAFGREFPVYYQYSDEDGRTIPNYMLYEQQPQYDPEGRLFVLSVTEGCSFISPAEKTETDFCCGSCRYFSKDTREKSSVFGLCLCEKRNLNRKEEDMK